MPPEPELPSELEEEEVPQARPKLALLFIALLVIAASVIYAVHQHRPGARLAYPPGLTLREERAAPPTSVVPSTR